MELHDRLMAALRIWCLERHDAVLGCTICSPVGLTDDFLILHSEDQGDGSGSPPTSGGKSVSRSVRGSFIGEMLWI